MRVSAVGLPVPIPHPRTAIRERAQAEQAHAGQRGEVSFWGMLWYLADGAYEAGRGDEAIQALAAVIDDEAIENLKQRAEASRR